MSNNEIISKEKYLSICKSLMQGKPKECLVNNNKDTNSKVDIRKINFNNTPPSRTMTTWWYSHFNQILDKAIADRIIENAIIHGSYGDGTFTNFSDIEITLLISDDSMKDGDYCVLFSNWIKKILHPFILKIDPLQHHSVFILWNNLILNYNDNILPTVSYSNCWSIKNTQLEFNVNSLHNNFSHTPFQVTISSLRNPSNFFKYGFNLYAIKRLLSNIALLPAFLYQSVGIMTSKPDAINKLLDEDMYMCNHVLKTITSYRESWPETPNWVSIPRIWFSNNNIPSGKLDLLFLSIYRNKNIETEIKNNLLPLLNQFCDELIIIKRKYNESV